MSPARLVLGGLARLVPLVAADGEPCYPAECRRGTLCAPVDAATYDGVAARGWPGS